MSATDLPPLDEDARHRAGRRSTFTSVAVNVVLTATQLVAGVLAHSQALVADGIHSLSDLVGDVIVLFAGQHSRKAPDHDHQYGHQRYENAASLMLGALLLGVGLAMLWSAVVKLEDPTLIPPVKSIALWVAVGTLVAKETLFRYMLAVAQRIRSGMLIANAWHARSDAASSLVVAVGIGGNLMGYRMLDPIAAMIVGFLVARMGWSFGWNALHDLMDRAADEDTLAGIGRTLDETPGVQGWHDLRTRKMGDGILVDVHLELDGTLTVVQGHRIAIDVRDRLMAQHAVLNVMTHVDPVEPQTQPETGGTDRRP
jgi:cation diffusion facilitator family transporter